MIESETLTASLYCLERAGMAKAGRVLHVIGAMDRGGAETLIMNIYRSINRDSVQFDFLVHDSRECDYDSEILNLGGKIHRLFRFIGVNAISYYRACIRFFSTHHDYIAVHVHIGSSAYFVIKAAKRFGLFTIAHSHNTNPPLSIMEVGFRFFSFPTRFVADSFFACSLQAGIDRFGKGVCSGSNFRVLINGISTDDYMFNEKIRKAVRGQLRIADNDYVFVHVGRFSSEKNHALLLGAFSIVHMANSHTRLVLVGRGPLEETLKEEVRKQGLSGCVLFLGVRNDVPNILMGADGFVFPSQWEGLGISAIEAQASGLPALLSTALPEIAFITDRTYCLDPSADAEKWSSEMLRMIRDSKGVSDRQVYARKIADAGFDIAEISDRLIDFYSSHSFEGWQ